MALGLTNSAGIASYNASCALDKVNELYEAVNGDEVIANNSLVDPNSTIKFQFGYNQNGMYVIYGGDGNE